MNTSLREAVLLQTWYKRIRFSIFVGLVAIVTLSMTASVARVAMDHALDRGKVGIVKVKGEIDTDLADRVVAALDRVARHPLVKAVVVRVDSPGGSVGPSQEIYTKMRELAATKPVVVSMGSIAASGGYYMSLPANRIVANPGTLTGSIGVIMTMPNVAGLAERLGVGVETIQSGDFKSAGAMTRQMRPEERSYLQMLSDDVYEQFVSDVAESRHLPVKRARELARGRIYTGRQAQQVGLIDELGGLDHAVTVAAEMAGLKGTPVRQVEETEKKGFFSSMAKSAVSAMGWLPSPSGLLYRVPFF